MIDTNPTTRIQPFQGEVLPWSRTLQNSPELCAVEGGDDVGSVLRVGCDPPGFPGFPLGVHQGAGQDVELLGVVKTPSDRHRSVLQLLQFHGAAWGTRAKQNHGCERQIQLGDFIVGLSFSLMVHSGSFSQRQNTNTSWNMQLG